MTKIQASKLGSEHLGRRVRLVHNELEITGVLRGVVQQADIITDYTLFEQEPRYLLGRAATTVRLLGLGESFEFEPSDELTLMT